MKGMILSAVCLLFLGACVSDPGELINRQILDPMSGTRNVDVFLLTNRAASNSPPACNSLYLQNVPGNQTISARCSVNVPARHSVGALDVPGDSSPDRDLFFYPGSYQPLNSGDLFRSAEESGEVLLFVHGFNVPFDEALLRSAQIKYDIKYQRPVFLFSWPAGGQGGMESVLLNRTYSENQKSARASVDALANLLRELRKRKVKVNLMVHSMGHQVAIPAMLKVIREDGGKPFIREAIFNAPDYPSGEFIVESADLKKAARRITLYCSPGDNALIASQKVNGNYRIGLCLRVDGVDVINVNEIDAPALGIGGLGHGYYSGRAIIVDIYQTLLGVEAEKRLFLRTSSSRMEGYVLRR